MGDTEPEMKKLNFIKGSRRPEAAQKPPIASIKHTFLPDKIE